MNFKLLWETAAKEFFTRSRAGAGCLKWSNTIRHRLRQPDYGRRLRQRLRFAFERYGRKGLALSATGVYNATRDTNTANQFDWNDCYIGDDMLEELAVEMSELESLKMATLFCNICRRRLLIDKTLADEHYCCCAENKAVCDPSTGWQPFLENKDIVIWRREQVIGQGLYAYKVYGRYSEVTARDFLAMHTDTAYWRTWDTSALSVNLLEEEESPDGGQSVIHWESLWPRFFANRDYVYVRRYAYLDKDLGSNPTHFDIHAKKSTNPKLTADLIVMVCKACQHPDAPESSKAFRVKEYWSNLVIKPFTDPDKPGIEFSLTYFDDPGVSIPSSLQSWVAGHACPDFMAKMRAAASVYQKYHEDHGPKSAEIHEKEFTVQSMPAAETNAVDNKMLEAIMDNLQTASENFSVDDEYGNIVFDRPTPIPRKVIIPIVSPIPRKNITTSAKTESDSITSTQDFLNLIHENKQPVSTDNIVQATEDYVVHVDSVNHGNEEKEDENNSSDTGSSRITDDVIDSNSTVAKLNREDVAKEFANEDLKKINGNESKTSNDKENPTRINQSQANGHSYWRFWPLYYFA